MAALQGRFDCQSVDLGDEARRSAAKQAVEGVLGSLPGVTKTDALVGAAVAEAVGFGALEAFLDNPAVQEITVEGPERILVDQGSGLTLSDARFSGGAALKVVAARLLHQGNEAPGAALAQTMLPNGAHVTVVSSPVAVGGPYIEVRRAPTATTLEALVQKGMASSAMADVLRRAAASGRNIAVLGPVGSGVTTLLGALVSSGDAGDRVIVAAEVPDLAVSQSHVVRLRSGAGSSLGEVALRAAQLRGDRFVVDGAAGASVFGALSAVVTRGQGSFIGVHGPVSPNPVESLKFHASLGGASEAAVAGLVSLAAQVVVQLDGGRIVAIAEGSTVLFRDGAEVGKPSF